jgi:Transposase IS66 family
LGRLEDLDLASIADERVRTGFVLLLNLVEELKRENAELRAENRRLRDEINRLKGEQGRPRIKGNIPKPLPTNYSSEQERRTPKAWSKGEKTTRIVIDREQTLDIAPELLPPDAAFKGHEDVVVQDVVFRTDNVLFHKEKFYSPAEGTTYLAPLPAGYDGQFGPGIKALSLALYFGANVSEPKIRELYTNVGIAISAGEVSNLLIKGQEVFHREKAAVHAAGLASSPWQNLDDTSTRVDGQNQVCQILGNPLYTSYHTTSSKDRQTLLDVLRNGRPREYLRNAEADSLLAEVLSGVAQKQVRQLPWEERWGAATMGRLLDERLNSLGPQQRKWVLDATAVAAYHAESGFPVVKLLVCDDAPQFTWLTEELALCWVHEARHYKKLVPTYPPFQRILADFMDPFWDYYDELLGYRENPTPAEAARLSARFDVLFSTTTDYYALADRIAKTKAKKAALLKVLDHPEIPLHNNAAELGARRRVRKRDVSFGPRTGEGANAWDTFMTLAATAQKLGVSFFAYVQDRISQANQIPGLADLISARATTLNLGPSWNTS